MVIDQSPANGFVARNADLAILPDQLAEEQYAIRIAKQNKELKKKINLAIRTLQNNGTQERILKNYLDDTSKGKSPYISPAGVERSNGTLIVATNATFETMSIWKMVKLSALIWTWHKPLKTSWVWNSKWKILNSTLLLMLKIGVPYRYVGMTVTDDRLKSIDFTEPYIRSTQVIVVRNGEQAAVADLQHKLYTNFIEENRWQYMASGLGNAADQLFCRHYRSRFRLSDRHCTQLLRQDGQVQAVELAVQNLFKCNQRYASDDSIADYLLCGVCFI